MESKTGTTRRDLLRAAGLGLTFPLLSACGGLAGSSDNTKNPTKSTLKIGFVSPRTGAAAGFGEPDAYVLQLAKKSLTSLTVNGTEYAVQILDRDSQSNPQRSAQVANDLINSDGVDLMLTTSTPETVNPVADACEAAGVPCISTVVPWEAWYFGRGAKPSDKKAFRYTYHFCFGVEQFASAYTTMWPQVPTSRRSAACGPTTPTATRSAPRSVPCSSRPATPSSTRAPTPSAPTTTRRRSRSSRRRTARSSTPSRSRRTSRPSGSRPRSRATSR